MKSPPSRGFDAPHVHSKLRKHPPRCTLDCGFKTPESPALRGFEAERCPITGTSLYLVLKSNGLRHSKTPPVKFGFSSKTVPANIVQKLPSQRCSKPLFIASFNFSHKRLAFAFTGESGYTLGFRRRIAHSGLHAETGGVSDGGGITTLSTNCTFTNIPGPGIRTANFAAFGSRSRVLPKNTESLRDSDALMRVAVPRRRGPAGLRDPLIPPCFYNTYISRFSVNPQHKQKRKIWQSCCHKFYPPTVFHPAFQLLAQMAHVRSHGRKWVHPRFCSEDRTQGHTRRNRGRFRWGRYYYPQIVLRGSETLRGRGLKRQTLPLLGLGWECSRRTQKVFGTAMRLCASLFRGVAAPLGCVIQ